MNARRIVQLHAEEIRRAPWARFMWYTQCLLARTVCLTASRNCSTEGEGMQSLSAPACIRRAFWSGRKSWIFPSSFLYAFNPSNSPLMNKKKAISDSRVESSTEPTKVPHNALRSLTRMEACTLYIQVKGWKQVKRFWGGFLLPVHSWGECNKGWAQCSRREWYSLRWSSSQRSTSSHTWNRFWSRRNRAHPSLHQHTSHYCHYCHFHRTCKHDRMKKHVDCIS